MDDLTTATEGQAWAKTSVWWDISRCPVPKDVDARRVVPFIKRGLKKLGYKGPLTITVIGILSEVPSDVLRAICTSTGVVLEHITSDTCTIMSKLMEWAWGTAPGSNVMLISSQCIFGRCLENIARDVNILGPVYPSDHILGPVYPSDPPSIFEWLGSPRGCFRWDSLLESIRADSNRGSLKKEECSGTGKDILNCLTCDLHLGRSDFAFFTEHLRSEEHARQDLIYCRRGFKILRASHGRNLRKKLKRLRKERRHEEREREARWKKTRK